MDTSASATADLRLVVGYDGSPPASRALDAAVRLLQGRTGNIDVVYVGHIPGVDMLSPGAVAEMDSDFAEIGEDLRKSAGEQLAGKEDRWDFQRREGLIGQELIAAATVIADAHPGDNVAIVVGSSSSIAHRVVGSVAVALARHSPVPLVIVP
jgi:nucleotide-binding universal stress UspA family protein